MRFVLGISILSIAIFIGCHLLGIEDSERERRRLQRQISEEVGVPVADSVQQCRTIAFGSKPCGGPWQYLVYSTAVSDSTRLRSLVSRYNVLEEDFNRRTGRASDCAFVMRPDTALVDGVCTAAVTGTDG